VLVKAGKYFAALQAARIRGDFIYKERRSERQLTVVELAA
jgi:hypothetical protein